MSRKVRGNARLRPSGPSDCLQQEYPLAAARPASLLPDNLVNTRGAADVGPHFQIHREVVLRRAHLDCRRGHRMLGGTGHRQTDGRDWTRDRFVSDEPMIAHATWSSVSSRNIC